MGGVEIKAAFLLLGLLLFLPGCRSSGAAAVAAAPDFSPYPWVYLRDNSPLTAGEPLVSLLLVGDVLLGRGVLAQPEPLADAAPWLSAADLTLGNLEGVLTDGRQAAQVYEPPPPGADRLKSQAAPIILTMPTTSVSDLQDAGFDLLGLANNHSLDLGQEGLAQSARLLQRGGLTPVGLQSGDLLKPAALEIRGVHLDLFAVNAVPDPRGSGRCLPAETSPCPALWLPDSVIPAIQQAKSDGSAVIVYIHWGFEYENNPDPAQESTAAALREAGADLIVGHHPHVAQPLAAHADGLTAYSLGNFVFDQQTAETQNALALLAYFDAQGLRAAQALPLRAGPAPRLLAPEESESWLDRLLPAPPRIALECSAADCRLTDAPPAGGSGRFFSGQIDLTGDGIPETVRREGERITIFESGTAVWQSPPEWRVVDADLGDPNDDGRYEIMLAIWRKDGAGYERSQPYIVGHRGGAYGLLWGGRPVVEPIQELALADVDGDGIEELVVIIEKANGLAQSLAVWQWQGWTFSLQWQSPPGRYQALSVEETGEQPTVTVSTLPLP